MTNVSQACPQQTVKDNKQGCDNLRLLSVQVEDTPGSKGLLVWWSWIPFLMSGVRRRVVSKRVVLADVPGAQKPERGYKNQCSWTRKPERGYKKTERGHIRQKRPFTKPPSCFLLIVGLENKKGASIIPHGSWQRDGSYSCSRASHTSIECEERKMSLPAAALSDLEVRSICDILHAKSHPNTCICLPESCDLWQHEVISNVNVLVRLIPMHM